MRPEPIATSQMKAITHMESVAHQVIADLKKNDPSRQLDLNALRSLLLDLREQAQTASDYDLASILEQISHAKALLERQREVVRPNIHAPFFAYIELEENGKSREILIGNQSYLDGPFPIIDWRQAPLAKVFFKYRTGEHFQEQLPGRMATGRVTARYIVTFRAGEIVGLTAADLRVHKRQGSWQNAVNIVADFAGGAGSATRPTRLGWGATAEPQPVITALLDPEQYAILGENAAKDLLILGGAGSGKTTVGMHRLASLCYGDGHGNRLQQERLLIVVPEVGLLALIQRMMPGLGLQGAKCSTYDSLVYRLVRRWFRHVPHKLCFDQPAAALKIKRHPRAIAVLKSYSQDLKIKLRELLLAKFKNPEQALARWQTAFDQNQPYLVMLKEMHHHHRSSTKSTPRIKVIDKFYQDRESQLRDLSQHRAELFLAKTRWLDDQDQASGQANQGDIGFGQRDLDGLYLHSHEQLRGVEVDIDYQSIDQDRLLTLDGHQLADEEKEQSLFGTIDPEDLTLACHLHYILTGDRLTESYQHVFIDEAQDFSPLELEVIAACRGDHGTLTIAGDDVQMIDPTSYFVSWDRVLLHLGVEGATRHGLLKTYRSTVEMTRLAYQVLGPYAPKEPPQALRHGPEVTASAFPYEGQVVALLAEALTDIMIREPNALVGVIAKDARAARQFFQALRHVGSIRLVENGQFCFQAGIDVTCVAEVKGLEFDYVIIPDASRTSYPNTLSHRRRLHVAITRAIHQIWLLATVELSPLIQNSQQS